MKTKARKKKLANKVKRTKHAKPSKAWQAHEIFAKGLKDKETADLLCKHFDHARWMREEKYSDFNIISSYKSNEPLPEIKKAEVTTQRECPTLPDVGRLRGDVKSPSNDKITIYAASPSCFYPKPPKIPLEGIRPIQVLRWAEQWREAYDSKGRYLTLQALRGMVLFSNLPPEDHQDADLLLRALYPEEAAEDCRRNRNEIAVNEQRAKQAIEAAKKRTEVKVAVTPQNQWGIPVEHQGRKYKIFGYNVTAVIRWMGADAWTEEDTRLALNLLGLKEVSSNTIKAQLRAGRDGSNELASLTPDQDERLNAVIVKAKPKPKKGKTVKKNIYPSKASRGKGIAGKESRPPNKSKLKTSREARRTAKKGRKS